VDYRQSEAQIAEIMMGSMSWTRKQSRPDAQPKSPIKYLTENGFSIIRLSDIDSSVVNTPGECRFLVQDERDVEREIKVNLSEDLITRIRLRRRGALRDKSVFWLVCAESRLARYLWEENDYPPNDRLKVNELSPDELMLAIHWRDQE
jgi:hypothetical protein